MRPVLLGVAIALATSQASPVWAGLRLDHGGPHVDPGLASYDVSQEVNTKGQSANPAPASHSSGGSTQPPAAPPSVECETQNIFECIPGHFCHLDAGGSILIWDGEIRDPTSEISGCDSGPVGPSLESLVQRAFHEVPLPAPVLDIQPPKGKTLIGLETIFSTSAPSFTRNLTLLGQQVELRIEASSFTWHHGDQTTQSTTWAGMPWREGLSIDRYITHVYEHTGAVQPTVAVTWSAEYRVNDGPWQPVNGTVTRAGAPEDLQIVEAEPHLVTG
jgi:hypothetical protein